MRKFDYVLAGCVLYLASAVCFIVASLPYGWATAGSVFFFLASVAHLMPFLTRK